MSDHWLYAPDLPNHPGDWTIQGPEAQHARVKRLESGEAVHLFNGQGHLADAEVLDAGKRALTVRILAVRQVPPRQPRLTVAVSPPKGERLDWMLEKLTELGVAAIIPLECERSVTLAREDRRDRWQRRLVEAAKQAHVAWLPTIGPPHKLPDLLARTGEFAPVLAADLAPASRPILASRVSPQDRPLLLIGPEGGFAQAEREGMMRVNAQPVSLGATVLRTETAAIVAACCMLAAADAGDPRRA